MTGAAVGVAFGGSGAVPGAIIGGLIGAFSGWAAESKRQAEALKAKKDAAVKAFGDLFDSWKQARSELAKKGAEGVNQLVGALVDENGNLIEGLTTAANAAIYVAATFAVLRASGMSTAQALEALKPALDAFAKSPEQFAGTAAEPLLQMAQWAEANAAMLQFLDGLGMTAVALAGFNMLTQDLANRIAADMSATIDKMVASGLTYDQALALSAQDLYDLKEAAERSGVTLDEHTQKLIDDAKAAGLFKDLEDPLKQLNESMGAMVVAMAELIHLFGGTVPAAVQKMVDEFLSAAATVGSAGAGPSRPEPGPGERPSFQGGSHGIVDFGSETIAALHGKEAVVSERDWMAGDRATAAEVAMLRHEMRVLLPTALAKATRDAMLKVVAST
jgi:hypothetical protein